MPSLPIQTSIMTLKNWKARREAKGYPVSPEMVERRVLELWSLFDDHEIAQIVWGVMEK